VFIAKYKNCEFLPIYEGVKTLEETPNIKVYPNPANDCVFIEHARGGKVALMDVNGTVVAQRDITTDKADIDIGALASGVYILRVTYNDRAIATKIIKQ
jgi:hypothetical protein